ncbi:hypothetical protein LPJ57_011070, partial [Coemansia sp. RSA 486]
MQPSIARKIMAVSAAKGRFSLALGARTLAAPSAYIGLGQANRALHTTSTCLVDDKHDSSSSSTGSGQAAEEPKRTLPQKASHIVRSILHGSEQVRQETRDTLSKVLARGKYVHELATHKVKPGCMDQYRDVVAQLYPYIVRNLSPGTKL